ncbi:hypothetical protein LCGC14_1107770 [marine sediment metagenome]|uniref:Uncharacterized protein n=1 Tax=marine sediment metagenome TaxID=412755 RepID=A0A0F9PQU4_9ZZZZ
MPSLELEYMHTVELLARMAYWSNNNACGSDVSEECSSCYHYDFCTEQERADNMWGKLRKE